MNSRVEMPYVRLFWFKHYNQPSIAKDYFRTDLVRILSVWAAVRGRVRANWSHAPYGAAHLVARASFFQIFKHK